MQTYTPGTALTKGALSDTEASLIPNQRKGYYFEIDDVNEFEDYCDDLKDNILDQKVNELYEAIDAYVLALYTDVASGNRVGVDLVGTMTVSAAGAATGTSFVAACAGRGIKFTAAGTMWYRVLSYDSATALTLEDDKDDESTHFDAGAQAANTAYRIEAVTPVEVTKTNIYAKIVALRTKLDAVKAPKANRWLVVNSSVAGLLLQSAELIPAVATAYEEVVKNGNIGRIAGFDVYESEQISGTDSSTAGLHILAGHISWMTFASAFVASTIEEDLPGEFGKAYKGLNCYGGKVIDVRRKMAAELFCYTA